MREQLLKRLSVAVTSIDKCVIDLNALYEVPKTTRRRSSVSARDIMEIANEQSLFDASGATIDISENDRRRQRQDHELHQRRQQRIQDLQKKLLSSISTLQGLIPIFRLATIEVVEAITTWRHALLQERSSSSTTVGNNTFPITTTRHRDSLYQFKYQGQNYLAKMAVDLQKCFRGIAFHILLGTPVIQGHPLLLTASDAAAVASSLNLCDPLHAPKCVFLTETPTTAEPTYPYAIKDTLVAAKLLAMVQERIFVIEPACLAVDPTNPTVLQTVRAIVEEGTLVAQDEAARDAEAAMARTAYDPFRELRHGKVGSIAMDVI
jgi:hypothetical protein